MNRRITSLIAVFVALSGFVLAVFIPAASAEKGHATYTEYCENGTNTVYSTYSQYCETTTTGATSTPSTSPSTVATSPSATPLTTSTASPATGTVPVPTVVPAAATGPVSLRLDKTLALGAVPGVPGLSVTAISTSGVTFDDGGTIFTFPFGAELSINPVTGACIVTLNGVQTESVNLIRRAPHVTKAPQALEQYVLLPVGRTSRQVFYVLPSGVTFGAHATWAQVKKAVTIYAVTNTKSLRVSRRAATIIGGTLTKAAANKGRWAFTLKAKSFMKAYKIVINLSALKYSKADAAAITAGHNQLGAKIAITSKTATTRLVKDHFTFTYTG